MTTMIEPAGASRFNPVSSGYDLYRPRYPKWVLDALAQYLAEGSAGQSLWLDVGSGTGIFARQLTDALPASTHIIAVEPSEAMRQQAIAASTGYPIQFVSGTAEHLPAKSASVDAISAATAAHWFDRPIFYAEAYRTLKPGGFFAIIEYVRDLHGSPAARELQAYLRREGDGDGYDRPDYEQELASLSEFEIIDIMRGTETLSLDHDAYLGLAFSSSHISACVKRLGEEQVRADLTALAAKHSDANSRIDYGYRMQIFVARKNIV